MTAIRLFPLFAILLAAIGCAGPDRASAEASAAGAVWRVDAGRGGDGGDGRERPFRSIQRGLDAAAPGDLVLVADGIYHERLVLPRPGTPGAPIVLRAARRGGAVVSGADPRIRARQVAWEPVDPAAGLYRLPFAYRPTRVLAGEADLLAYPALADLRAFRFLADDYPGHPHGFAWHPEDGHLYVRLRADGRYGATDPNRTVMAVSPPPAAGPWGDRIDRPQDILLRIPFRGPAHVVVEGFTFETPGFAAIHTEAGDLTVRACRFLGCRTGVMGRDLRQDRDQGSDRILVEDCDFTQFPAFSDIEEVIAREAVVQRSRPEWWQHLMHWQRKGSRPLPANGVGRAHSYEAGCLRNMARGWVVRGNRFVELFEALSSGSTSWSQDALIEGNRFERICDNAIETEGHAARMTIRGNTFVDVFEPISWQPQDGGPLPGPVWIQGNRFEQTPATAEMWRRAGNLGGVFKLGIKAVDQAGGPAAVVAAPGGFWVVGNTIVAPEMRLVTSLNPPGCAFQGFAFLDNQVSCRSLSNRPVAGSGLAGWDNRLQLAEADPAGEAVLSGSGAGSGRPALPQAKAR